MCCIEMCFEHLVWTQSGTIQNIKKLQLSTVVFLNLFTVLICLLFQEILEQNILARQNVVVSWKGGLPEIFYTTFSDKHIFF